MNIDSVCRVVLIEKSKDYYYLIEPCLKKIDTTGEINYSLTWYDNFNHQLILERNTQKSCIYLIDLKVLTTFYQTARTELDLLRAIAHLKASVLISPSNPIIILTDDYQTGIQMIKAGATDYLSKTELTTSTIERSLRLSLFNSQIEQQKQAEIELRCQELARSNAELEQFAYIASHDLQAPLHTITNYAQLLEFRYQEKLDQKASKYLNYIIDSATRMKTQIEDLLEYSCLGRQKSTWRETDLYLVVQQAIANLQLEIETNQVEIHCDRIFPTLVVDSSQLVVLWQNLLENSIKYCRQEPLIIQIRVDSQDNYWQFSVTDNGLGFEPQYKQRIFQIFQRLHTQDEYPGNGIGLAICQKIVEQHGGNIWVESQIDQGSTFYFTIPH